MLDPYLAAPDIHVLPSELRIPDVGLQPVNAYLVRSAEPMLVDTGMPVDRVAFQEQLWSLVDPEDLRWVIVTHDDRDHTGSLMAILERAPHARLITNGVSLIRLTEEFDVPFDRVVQVNPGQRIRLGGRRLELFRPPVFDSPGTIAVLDHESGTLFSSDSFGTILPGSADAETDVLGVDYLDGFDVFNRAIAPWSALARPEEITRAVDLVRRLAPARLLSSHGATVTTQLSRLLNAMNRIPALPAWLPGSDLDDALAGAEEGQELSGPALSGQHDGTVGAGARG